MDLNSKCDNTYWTNKRYSEDSIDAMNQAINKITSNGKFELVGYSGGGGVAVLIAARNKNVNSLLTIAANLDIDDFVKYHKTAPMVGSLNPIDYTKAIKNVPQLHFSGGMDKIVPVFIGEKFVGKITTGCARHEVIPEVEHTAHWKKYWSYIINSSIVCSTKNLN
jgi:pimeloyl-ACP methyl ester carboxylesterase